MQTKEVRNQFEPGYGHSESRTLKTVMAAHRNGAAIFLLTQYSVSELGCVLR